ncbi:PAS domain-containing protein [Oceaniglobus indicus]|uniref:PAS domain-containing protein n=1 Tax=Oceaniglobus indicus TaxID=2047749 RepID=UPI001F4D92A5|nr:PAS domain-containing protein [Oceaniglobus indicus]
MDKPVTGDIHGLSAGEAFQTFSRSNVAMVLTNPKLDDNPIVYVNDAFVRLTGYSREMAIGRNCRFLQGEGTDPDDIAKVRRIVSEHREGAVDVLNYRADGATFINHLFITPIVNARDKVEYFLGIQINAGDQTSVHLPPGADKIMREIQHRVKNHLSMIVGMIRLQARESTAADEYRDLSRRVESLQLLYEELTQIGTGDDAQEIQLGSYLSRVANAIGHIDGRAGVRMNIIADAITMPVDSATRVGLILSEVLTNAMQHAFEGRDKGLVEVRLSALSDGGARVSVSDDGVGIPHGVKWPETNSLGGRIVLGLVDGLNATFDVTKGASGTVVTLDVPAPSDA